MLFTLKFTATRLTKKTRFRYASHGLFYTSLESRDPRMHQYMCRKGESWGVRNCGSRPFSLASTHLLSNLFRINPTNLSFSITVFKILIHIGKRKESLKLNKCCLKSHLQYEYKIKRFLIATYFIHFCNKYYV